MEEKPIATQEDEINLLDYLIVLAKRKIFIVKVTLGFAILAAIISLIISPVYKAETKILPPVNGGSGIATQLMNQFGATGRYCRYKVECRSMERRQMNSISVY